MALAARSIQNIAGTAAVAQSGRRSINERRISKVPAPHGLRVLQPYVQEFERF
jgi:hypothetical protein